MIRSAFFVITLAADKIHIQPHILIMRRHQYMLTANVSSNKEPHQPNYLEDILKSQNKLITIYLNHHSKCQAVLILAFVFGLCCSAHQCDDDGCRWIHLQREKQKTTTFQNKTRLKLIRFNARCIYNKDHFDLLLLRVSALYRSCLPCLTKARNECYPRLQSMRTQQR